jgi:DNA-directed RNA polymerase
MLARAAQRKLRNDALRSHAHELTLPWLCPAMLRRTAPLSTRAAYPQPADSRRPRRTAALPRHDTRSLATAAELQPPPSPPSPSPFHGFMQAWGSRVQPPELARLSPWDASNPLVLRDPLSVPRYVQPRAGVNIGSDAVELYQNLYACLRVGRFERAEMILGRLRGLYAPTAPELVDAHNIYLQTLFEHAQQDPKPDSMAELEDWYEAEMESNGVPPNAQTFVTLLRGAMNFLDEAAYEPVVRRFLAMAADMGEDVLEDINYSPEFSDEEWDVLIRAQPDAFEEPPRIDEVHEQLVNEPEARKTLMNYGIFTDVTQKIKPVEQKGLGLDSLRQALAIFQDSRSVPYPDDMEGTREEKDLAYAYARQLRLESDALQSAVTRWRLEDEKLVQMGVHGVMSSKSVQALMYNWYVALVPLFKKEIDHAKAVMAAPPQENYKDNAQAYGIWLERCKPEQLAALTVSRAIATGVGGDRTEGNAFKIANMTVRIGTDIMDYLNTDAQARRDAFLKKQRKQLRKDLINRLLKVEPAPQPTTPSSGQRVTPIEKTLIPIDVRTKMGAMALELLLKAATITITAEDPRTGETLTNNQAAFKHDVGFAQGKKIGFLVPHYMLVEKLRNESVQHIRPVSLPMVVKPKPWTSFEDGGYYTLPGRVVRQKAGDPAQRQYAQSAIENGDMNKVLAGLDVLGRVPWQINTTILNVMTQAWNNGEGIGGLVPEATGLERPEEPPNDASYAQRAKWGKELQQYENTKGGLHSQRCFQNFQLETARAFAEEKEIYFPHSVDFRGRAYPLPPMLNHIGSDVARGLLKFAYRKELGTVGLQWLKIHLANLYGYDKASLKEREQFAMDNLTEIYDSASHPLDGRRWWASAEDPWQCLACCMELKNALDSPDPTRYMSQLPVHQDGTCNGLQHYAALGGDHAGARQVNLEPSDRPQDIYTGVADLVKEMVAKDAAQGLTLANFINGHITRKVVKRTVMTNVYGVTFMGAKAQVEDELRSLFPNFKETSSVKSLGSVALYIAFKIFEALGKIFNGAQDIQHWLGECGSRITTSLTADQVKRIGERDLGEAFRYDSDYQQPEKVGKQEAKRISKHLESFKTSIIWTTPRKMPIVQPYRKDTVKTIKTKLQSITLAKRAPTDAVDKRKQLQAFPPNFIHSLDATHMTLSALKCNEMGLDFAAVHDSFWTHACDIPSLNVILRDAFVRMHSEDIIQRLAEEFKARYAGAMYPAGIYSHSEVGTKIRQWRVDWYRSQGKWVTKNAQDAPFAELAMEAQRMRLLASDDPEEVKQGQQIVTPTSIWLETSDPKSLSFSRTNTLGETGDKRVKKSKFTNMTHAVADREAEVIAQSKAMAAEATAQADDPHSALAQSPLDITDLDPTELSSATEKKTRQRSADGGTISVWLPLTVPPVPKKGGWDVSRLRESKYFFS